MTQMQQIYRQQIATATQEKEKFSGKQKHLPLLRFTTFSLALLLIYVFFILNDSLFIWFSMVALVSFIALTIWDHLLKIKMERFERIIRICHNEISALNGDYSAFDQGNEYIDTDHNYTYDLDIFGKNSLFNCITRSVTIFGKNRLAACFYRSFDFVGQINDRQKAIEELAANKDFRQKMQLVFYGQKSSEKDRLEFDEWLGRENFVVLNPVFNLVRFLLPALTVSSVVLSILGPVIIQIPVMMVILQLLIVSFYARKTMKVQSLLTSKVGTLSKYAHFLSLAEQSRFHSPLLVDLQKQLSYNGNDTPAKIIRKLSRLLNWMDTNLNILAAVVLNGLFLFNLQMLVAVEKWKIKYGNLIPTWFEIIGEFDALSSLANFSYNHPGFIFPEPVIDKFCFEAEHLGHPLIPTNECVTNSIEIRGWNQYCIITGANMSGKSTFLRTVGVNYLLAMMGAPVFATKFVFHPLRLHSSIRTSDSLARKESFFYAELKRLKGIISELESGQQTFILLDEILKGTNSKDKQAGSIALLEQLIKYQSVGLIATHDLVLGDLIGSYPDNISNLCFEIQIVEDEMSIDYKLQAGVCQNLNATYLMKKMGILIDKA